MSGDLYDRVRLCEVKVESTRRILDLVFEELKAVDRARVESVVAVGSSRQVGRKAQKGGRRG